jgi:hypothetical protein
MPEQPVVLITSALQQALGPLQVFHHPVGGHAFQGAVPGTSPSIWQHSSVHLRCDQGSTRWPSARQQQGSLMRARMPTTGCSKL